MVEQRLPAGAVAVLINPRHTFTDLYLPLDAEQKSLFDLIDGRRSIGQIIGKTGQRNLACSLFEQLWQYDQIVFDASRLSK